MSAEELAVKKEGEGGTKPCGVAGPLLLPIGDASLVPVSQRHRLTCQ